MTDDDVPCKTHPDAPHGFMRAESHSLGRYVCECEHWSPTVSSLPSLTSAKIIEVAKACGMVTGENQHSAVGYLYRSRGVASNVIESDLVEFAHAIERAHGIGVGNESA